ncbi:MAG TPA: hypothetical protein EYP59_03605 [Thiotrichaceae bacterium]|nr:hypothetical protein [Thiotrichaceae bacterium]
MLKKTIVVLPLLFTTGCATNIKENVHNYRQQISESENSIQDSESFLQNNPDLYVGGTCIKPRRGKKPEPFCESKKKAKEFAVGYCVMPLGCDAGMALSDDLDSFSKKFLASEACSQLVNELRGDGYSPEDTMVNILESGVDSLCEEGGFWSIITCTTSVIMKFQKVAAFSSCVDKKSEDCYSNYNQWRNGPQKRQESCEEHVANINSERKKLEQNRELLSEAKSTFAWKIFGDD